MSMLSMTGFGSGEATAGPVTVQVELRSVNHRFLDLAFKLPSALLFQEIELRNRLKDVLARGRVTCSASLSVDPAAAVSRLEPARVDAAIALLQDAADRLAVHTGLKQEVRLLRDGVVEPGVMTSLRQDFQDADTRYLMVINTLHRPRTLKVEAEQPWKVASEYFHAADQAVLDGGARLRLAPREVYLFKLVRQ